jgi:hypothetical protein
MHSAVPVTGSQIIIEPGCIVRISGGPSLDGESLDLMTRRIAGGLKKQRVW